MSQPRGDIAIIGMACIYPGAPNIKAFWQNILSKVDAVSEPPESWRADHFFDPESKSNDRIYCKRGGFIEEFAEFNPRDYGIMPNAVDGGDPEHFLCLRVVNEALADAGYLDRKFNRERTALILGRGNWMNRGYYTAIQHTLVVDQTLNILKQLHPETSDAELQDLKQELKAGLPPFNADTSPGLVPNLITGRIANRLDLQGPNYTVDAACASSLIALDMGMRELLTHRCDMAIIGGANVSTPPPIYMMFCHLGALSRSGRIRPFDKDADGTLLGEGIGMMVIKRREDAEQDGDRIYALIKGVGVASDGRAVGVLVPRLEGELLALQRAYEASAISPETIGLIEAHGTGTKVGDLTEIQAMTRMFGPCSGVFPRCAIGSVKSMISHTIPAAGVAGLIKSALALYHKILPPTLCDEPNPEFELEKTPFYVNTETRPWIHGEKQPRRAGVNAFGFGGINAHAILEEYTGNHAAEGCPSLLEQWDTEVIIVQGESREDLMQAGENLLLFISGNQGAKLKDVAYTLNCPLRNSAVYRLAIVASSVVDLEKKLDHALKRLAEPKCQHIKDRSGIFFFVNPLGRQGKIAFLFPGEGSQYVNMLSDLCIHFPEVRGCFDRVDRVFVKNERKPLPSQVVFPPPLASPETNSASERTLLSLEYAVPLVCAANYGLKNLLDRLEISPQALVGHSTGEITAALASGIVGDQDEDWLFQHGLEINVQSQLIEQEIPLARLLAVGATDPSVVAAIAAESGGELYVAMDNCPNQVVLCGSEAAIEGAYESLKKKGAICNYLPFDRGYHTPWYKPVCEHYVQSVERLEIQPPKVEIYSYVTADLYPEDPDEIRQIMTEQWARPVRFRETIEAMHEAGVRIFVEVGPKENLTSFVEDTLGRRSYVAVAANSSTRSGISQLNHMLGLLAAHGVPMRLDHLYAHRNPIQLPIKGEIVKREEEAANAAGKATGKSGTMKLPLELPWLTLDRETSVQTRPADPEAVQGRAESDATIETQPSRTKKIRQEAGAKGSAKKEIPVEATSTYAENPATISPVSPRPLASQREVSNELSRPSGLRSRVMQEYLHTMEQFLEHQKEIMGTFLEKKATTGKKDPTLAKGFSSRQAEQSAFEKTSAGIHSVERPVTVARAGSALQEAKAYRSSTTKSGKSLFAGDPAYPQELSTPHGPFGIVVSSLIPEKELIATCQLDLKEQIFLRHHTLGETPSKYDETLTGLPIVPLTISTEIMAQAASLLVQNAKLIAMTNFRAHNWIEVTEDKPRQLLIIARKIESQTGNEVEVKLLAPRNISGSRNVLLADAESEENQLLVQGCMVFDNVYPNAGPYENSQIDLQDSFSLEAEEIYREILFHGPTFHGIASVDRIGDQGLEATLFHSPDVQLFRSTKDSNMLTAPMLLDAAGQVLACWTWQRSREGFVVFPTGFKAIRFYDPPSINPELVKCYARINMIDGNRLQTDMDLVDSKGDLIIKFEGWEDACFFEWTRLFLFCLEPCSNFLSTPWRSPMTQFPDSNSFRVRLCTETANGIWLRALAQVTLNRKEREIWNQLSGPERRRRQWLVGRLAAKDAVRLILKDLYHVEACPADVEISTYEYGKPVVSGELVAKLGCSLGLSIAHSDDAAVAVVRDCGKGLRGIGIDIERSDRNHEGLEEAGFKADELSLLDRAPGQKREEWLLRLWCAKEALAKALGRGMMGNPLNFVVEDVSIETGRVNLRIDRQIAQEFRDLADKPFNVQTGCDETLIFGISVV